MAVAEGKLKVGQEVVTPDGHGKVTKVGERFISVDLDSKLKGQYTVRDLILPTKKEEPKK